MSKHTDSSHGYFRWLLIFILAGIAWFMFENGADILKAGGVSLHEKKPNLSAPIFKPSPNEIPESASMQ